MVDRLLEDSVPDTRALIRDKRAAINRMAPDQRPLALADLADLVERDGLPGVARSLRLKAIEEAREHLGPDAPLIGKMEALIKRERVSARPCPRNRPAPPDPTVWKERMEVLAHRSRRRR